MPANFALVWIGPHIIRVMNHQRRKPQQALLDAFKRGHVICGATGVDQVVRVGHALCGDVICWVQWIQNHTHGLNQICGRPQSTAQAAAGCLQMRL